MSNKQFIVDFQTNKLDAYLSKSVFFYTGDYDTTIDNDREYKKEPWGVKAPPEGGNRNKNGQKLLS